MNESTPDVVRLRVRCCGCNRTAEVSLPIRIDRETLERQLAERHWSLSPVARRHDEQTQVPPIVEPLCGVCEEAEMRWP